jgi:hypothetical protein
MSGQFGLVQGVRGLAASLAQDNAVAHVHWHASLQIGKSKRGAAVAAVGGAENGKQCLVLVDGQKLSIAESPAFGREIPADDFYFAKKWL